MKTWQKTKPNKQQNKRKKKKLNEILLNDVLVYAQRVETYSNETKKKRKKQKLQKKKDTTTEKVSVLFNFCCFIAIIMSFDCLVRVISK